MARPATGEPPVESPEAYEAALAAYAVRVEPRAQVPSVREVDGGVVQYEFRPPPSAPTLIRPSIWRRLGRDLRLFDPRTFATRETMYPLLVLTGLSTAAMWASQTFLVLLFLIQGDMRQEVGFIYAILGLMELVRALSAPLAGFIADRIRRVHMLRWGTIIMSASVVLTGLAPNVAVIAMTRVMGAIGSAIYEPAVPPLLTDYFPVEKRARVFGFQSLALVAWTIATSFFVTYGIYVGGVTWRQTMVGAGVLAAVVSIFTFRLREPIRGEVDRRSMGMSPEAAKRQQKPASWREAWRTCASVGTLRKLWYATPFLYIGQRGIGWIIGFAVQAKAVTVMAGGSGGGIAGPIFRNPVLRGLIPAFMIISNNILQVVIAPVAFSIADRLLRERPGRIMTYFGAVMAATGGISVLALVSPDPLIMMILGSSVGALAGLIGPARGMLLSVVIPARVRGQGFQTVAPFEVVGIIAFMTLGKLVSTFGATTAALILMVFLLAGAVILVLSGVDVRRDIQNSVAASMAEEESQRARATGRAKMIITRNLGVAYDGAQVLFDVDFDVDDGELVAVLGTNGAGKSTLLKAIAGIHEPSAGAIFLDGEDITHKPAFLNARDGIVFLPGGRAIFPTLTVEENLRAAAWLYKDDDDYVRARTEEILTFFPVLRERLTQHAGDLSGGEQQMLALGQAFLMRPRLLMIDELSLGLAPQIVERLLDIVRAIHRQGTTVLLVEQSVNVALTVATRAVFMDKGEIRFDGPTEALMRRSDLVRAVFLGHVGGAGIVGLNRRHRRPAGEEPERALAIENVHVNYGGIKALDGVTLEVTSGEIVGVIGPNGAGKTTLFDVISGFIAPAEGRILVGTIDATELPPDARANLGLARSFQDTRLFQSLTVRETIAVALQRRVRARNPVLAAAWAPSIRKAERHTFRRVEYLVELLGLGPHADKFINELSTGTRRMVDIACVMAAEPRILLLDEPSSGLAQAEIEVFGPVVHQIGKETGCGVLVIEHDIPLVTSMSDRLVAMELGHVIAEGNPDDVAAHPQVMSAYLSASDAVIKRSGTFNQALAALGGTATPGSSGVDTNES